MNDKTLNGLPSKGASLSQLYRRMTVQSAQAAEIEADELVAAASGKADEALLTRLASSPVHADLTRLLRDLEPASAELAGSVHRHGRAHPQRDRAVSRPAHQGRHAAHRGARWFRGLAAAAGLAMALGIVSLWHGHMQAPHPSANVASSTAPDRIFTSNDRIFASNEPPHAAAPRHGHDKVFRGDFSGS